MSGANLVVLSGAVPNPDSGPHDGLSPRRDYELIRQRIAGSYIASASLTSPVSRRLAGRDDCLAAALAAFEAKGEDGNIFVTGEDIAYRLLPMLNAARWPGRLFAVIHASHGWKWRQAARLLGDRNVGGYYTVSTAQRDVLVKGAGLSPDKVHFIYDSVDADFYDPAKAPGPDGEGYVFACGLENRDYDTLTRAAALTGVLIRVQAFGYFPKDGVTDDGLPANMDINRTRLEWTDLRARYGASRLAVVPLHAVPYAAGVNGLMEAMAMGKAVIVTESPGLSDYTGAASLVRVPPANPARLAAEIDALWNDPAACAERGRANRDWILQNATVEKFAGAIASGILDR